MQQLFDLFEEMGKPYFRQGSLSDEQYQPEFFTFWNDNTPTDSFYDDHETRYIEHVQIGFYTNDAKKIYSGMDEFIEKAKANGFVLDGRPHDANADKDGFFGRVCYIRIINKI